MDFMMLGTARRQVNGARLELQRAEEMFTQLTASGTASPELRRYLQRLQTALHITVTSVYNTLTGLGVVR